MPPRYSANSELDPQQRACAHTEAERVLVLAGAGSGKTRTLVHRVAHLVEQRTIDPSRILLATFTQRAAREVRARLEARLGVRARGLKTGTFHALALRFVRVFADHLGLVREFTLLNRDERTSLMKGALLEAGLDPRGRRGPTPERFSQLLGRAVNDERPLPEILDVLAPDLTAQAALLEQAADAYARLKAGNGALDFDDLLVLWRTLLNPDEPETARRMTSTLDHVLVDEYQDTTSLQAEIAESLAETAAIFVVGDDAQSIYGFRGARFENILEFPLRAPTEVHRLVTSYRSGPEIVAVARAALELNPLQFPKPLESALPPGSPVRTVTGEDEDDEARQVLGLVKKLSMQGVPYGEQAILVRRHRDALAFELALTAGQIPYRMRSGRRFLDRPHVSGAVAHLRVLLQPADLLAWRKVLALRPGVGPRTVETLLRVLDTSLEQERVSLAELIDGLVKATPRRGMQGIRSLGVLLRKLSVVVDGGPGEFFQALLESTDQGIEALTVGAEDPDAALRDLEELRRLPSGPTFEALDDLQLGESTEDPSSEGAITVSTVHGAKGLEWTAVFVCGLIDGRFPLEAALREVSGEAEERRLFYVAVTRAARHLVLARSSYTRNEHGLFALSPSRFLEELPEALYRPS